MYVGQLPHLPLARVSHRPSQLSRGVIAICKDNLPANSVQQGNGSALTQKLNELQADPPDVIMKESRQVTKSIFAIADIMKNVGRQVKPDSSQPCVVIMLEGLEDRDPVPCVPLGGEGSDSPGALNQNYQIHF